MSDKMNPEALEMVPTGISWLDEMFHGDIYRGTDALITGSAGTGKSTLAGLSEEASCRRGERALFVSFDENSRDIVRDLASISVQLAPHLKSGLLRMDAVRTESASSEDHLMRIKHLIREHKPACVAIDPISALVKVGGEDAARNAAERLIYFCRNERLSVIFTSLLEGRDAALETTPIHVSTLADTWIQISYLLHAGERNRALTIIKSRGSKHSNQMRELVFSDSGVTLADPYTAGGEVLMGTLRIEREPAVAAEQERLRREIEQKRREIERIELDRDLQIEAVRRDVEIRAEELARLTRASTDGPAASELRRDEVVRKRDDELVLGQVNGGKSGNGKAHAPTKARAKSK